MTTIRVGRSLLAARSSFCPGRLLAGGGGGDDSPPPPPRSSPHRRRRPRRLRPPAPVPAPGAGVTSGDTFGVTSTGRLVTFDRADPALDTAIADHAAAGGRNGPRPRRTRRRRHPRRAVRARQHRPPLHDQHDHGRRDAQIHARRGCRRCDRPVHRAVGHGIRRRLQPGRGSPARRQRYRARTCVSTSTPAPRSPTRRSSTGGAARAGVNGAAYTNAFAAACRTALYYIDATTDQLLTTSDPNGGAVTVVGALGVDTSAASDFEIATAADGTNNGYAVLVVGNVPTSYQINLSTGVAATGGAVTRLDANELVRDTAIAAPATAPTQARGDVFALTEANKLVSFNSWASAEGVHQRRRSRVSRAAKHRRHRRSARGRARCTRSAARAGCTPSTPPTAALTLEIHARGGARRCHRAVHRTARHGVRLRLQSGQRPDPGGQRCWAQNFRITPDDGVVTTDVELTPAGSVRRGGVWQQLRRREHLELLHDRLRRATRCRSSAARRATPTTATCWYRRAGRR